MERLYRWLRADLSISEFGEIDKQNAEALWHGCKVQCPSARGRRRGDRLLGVGWGGGLYRYPSGVDVTL